MQGTNDPMEIEVLPTRPQIELACASDDEANFQENAGGCVRADTPDGLADYFRVRFAKFRVEAPAQ